jgi:spermidine/putrescine transport system permease protein
MKNKLSWFAVPYVGWMALMVVIPILIMVVYAFTTADFEGTTENFSEMGLYASVFVRSFRLALIATLVCLFIGYPVSYWMAHEGPGFQRVAMALIMLPMWMNFLLRTYSWMSILENNGLLNQLFQNIGVIALYNRIAPFFVDIRNVFAAHFGGVQTTFVPIEHFQMINTSGAVVLGMVYNYLPFMILPIYSVIVKLDHSLLEAARDLGADSRLVFRKVIFPLSLPGVLSGVTMVFVPSVSTFAISRLLGGGTQMMLGDLIELQFLGGSYDPHLGAAISMVMMAIVVVCMVVMNRFGEGEGEAVLL